MKRPSSKARGEALQSIPFEYNKVDFAKFKTELSASDIAKLTIGIKVWPFGSIEMLSPRLSGGAART